MMNVHRKRVTFSDALTADDYLKSVMIVNQTHVRIKGMPVQLKVYREGASVWFEGVEEALKIAMMHVAQYLYNNECKATADYYMDTDDNGRKNMVTSTWNPKTHPRKGNLLQRIGEYITSLFKPLHAIIAGVLGVGCSMTLVKTTTYFGGGLVIYTAPSFATIVTAAAGLTLLALVAQGIVLALLRLKHTGSLCNTEDHLVRTPVDMALFGAIATFIFDLRGLVLMTYLPATTVLLNAFLMATAVGVSGFLIGWAMQKYNHRLAY